MNDKENVYTFEVTVKGEGLTPDQAEQVMAERLTYDEDYGFDYIFGNYEMTSKK